MICENFCCTRSNLRGFKTPPDVVQVSNLLARILTFCEVSDGIESAFPGDSLGTLESPHSICDNPAHEFEKADHGMDLEPPGKHQSLLPGSAGVSRLFSNVPWNYGFHIKSHPPTGNHPTLTAGGDGSAGTEPIEI